MGGVFGIPVEVFDMMEAMMADELGDEYGDEEDDEDDDENEMEKMMGIFSMMKEVGDEDDYDSDDYDEDDIAAAFGLHQADLGSLLMGELLAAERRHGGGGKSSSRSMTGSPNCYVLCFFLPPPPNQPVMGIQTRRCQKDWQVVFVLFFPTSEFEAAAKEEQIVA